MTDRRWELPTGWHVATLRDLCLPIQKVEPSSLGRGSFRYVDIGSIDGSRQVLVDVPIVATTKAPSRARQELRRGDTVFSTVRPYLRKIAFIDDSLEGEIASTGFCVLRPDADLLPRFLFHYAVSDALLDQVLPLQRGVSYPAVLSRDVLAARVPVPPIDEQRRIVEILEDHLSRLDAADAYLDASSRRLASLELRHAERLVGASGGRRTTLGELAIDCGYGTSTKCVVGGPGSPVVRIPNLVSGRIDLTDEKRVADPKVDVSSTELTSGDLLVVRTNGSRDLIGRAAVVQPGVEASFASYLIRFQLDRAQVRPDWVRIVLGAPTTRRRLEGLAASSAGQYNLGLKKLSGVRVPVPSLEAQDRMLLEYEDGLDCSRRMASATRDARARSTRLRRALLHAAFTGRLTGRDRDADVLGELEDLSRVAQFGQG